MNTRAWATQKYPICQLPPRTGIHAHLYTCTHLGTEETLHMYSLTKLIKLGLIMGYRTQYQFVLNSDTFKWE